jgi:hypothetical protein
VVAVVGRVWGFVFGCGLRVAMVPIRVWAGCLRRRFHRASGLLLLGAGEVAGQELRGGVGVGVRSVRVEQIDAFGDGAVGEPQGDGGGAVSLGELEGAQAEQVVGDCSGAGELGGEHGGVEHRVVGDDHRAVDEAGDVAGDLAEVRSSSQICGDDAVDVARAGLAIAL